MVFTYIDPFLSAQPQIYTRGTVLNDFGAFLVALAGGVFLLAILLAPILEVPQAPVTVIVLALIVFLAGPILAKPVGSKLKPRVRSGRDHFKKTEKWAMLVVLLLVLLLRVRTTWPPGPGPRQLIEWLLASVALSGLTTLAMSLVIGVVCRIFLQFYNQAQAWNSPAFADWTDAHHEDSLHDTGVFNKKSPDPESTNPPLTAAAAMTYGTWCTEQAVSVSLFSQLLVLLGGAFAGTGLPLLIFDQTKFMYALIVVLLGIVPGGGGLLWSQDAVSRWN